MRTRSIVLLFGVLTISAPCLAATDVPASLVEGSPDYRFFEIEKDLPGFGGMFLDANGELNAYMLHPEAMPQGVEAYLREFQSKTEHQPVAAIKMLQGQFSFSQLARWRERLLPELPFERFVFLDIDETRNRLVIGVSDPAAMRFVRDNVIPSDIPQEAVIIEEAEPIQELEPKTLDDRIRPAIGGIKIERLFPPLGCTLGFNAVLDGIKGFVTNSHCTRQVFSMKGADSNFFQPSSAWPIYLIGEELRDPYGFEPCPSTCRPSPCPSPCDGYRWSDSAFVKYSGSAFALGTIAKTNSINIGSIDEPKYEITGKYIITGETCPSRGIVEKVGQKTGWTTGEIYKTCFDMRSEKAPRKLLRCQYKAKARSNGEKIADDGDSGSPVFIRNSNKIADKTVTLVGILFGGLDDGSDFTYSCIKDVRKDLGDSLTVVNNVAFGKPLTVTTNGADDPSPGGGHRNEDITDGKLDYKPASATEEDGVIGFGNNDYYQQMEVTVKIDLGQEYDISSIRYNMGNVQFGNTWKPDLMMSSFKTSGTTPGGSYKGAWTTHEGHKRDSSVKIKLTKTRRAWNEDWLFIGKFK